MKVKKLKSNLENSKRILCVVELDSESLGIRVYNEHKESASIQVDKSKLIKLIDTVRNLKGSSPGELK